MPRPDMPSLRKSLSVAMGNAKAANLIIDAIVAMQSTENSQNAKLDADNGVTDTDYAATLDQSVIDPDASL